MTTHGDLVADRLAAGGVDYQLEPDAAERVAASYRERGFGYADYEWSPGYGVSALSPDWLRAAAPLPVAHHSPHCWDDHQDVYALTRRT